MFSVLGEILSQLYNKGTFKTPLALFTGNKDINPLVFQVWLNPKVEIFGSL
jgi:hypothetical protein